MNSSRLFAFIAMLLMCVLPLLVFFVLAGSGMSISPVLVMFVLIVCCMMMMHLMMGDHEHAGGCHGQLRESSHAVSEPELPESLKTEDLFHVIASENTRGILAINVQLLADPETVSSELEIRMRGSGLTALLQEDELGRTRVLILPAELKPAETSRRNLWINVGLFAATILTTTWAGALHRGVNLLEQPGQFMVGVPYALGLMLILTAHEFGHYFAARIHGMKVTLPYFIPVPFALGTFGAFIQLLSPSNSRKTLFDVGVAGPLAGLVFAIPALFVGLTMSEVVTAPENAATPLISHHGVDVGSSVLLTAIAKLSMGDAVAYGHVLALHPLAFAGWLGLLVTALNLLPIGQLDGGHIADAMFGPRRSAAISSAALFTLFFLGIFVWSGLLFWAFIAWIIAGRKGLPPLNDITKLDLARFAVGVFTFMLLLSILIPIPHALWQSLGIHCPYL